MFYKNKFDRIDARLSYYSGRDGYTDTRFQELQNEVDILELACNSLEESFKGRFEKLEKRIGQKSLSAALYDGLLSSWPYNIKTEEKSLYERIQTLENDNRKLLDTLHKAGIIIPINQDKPHLTANEIEYIIKDYKEPTPTNNEEE